MNQLRVNFLNWRPDIEDTEHDGLTVAQNVVHAPEGYQPVYLASTGTLSTTGGLASVSSIVTKAVGSGDDTFSAWISGNTIHVGLNGVTASTTSTGYPLSFATAGTSQEITHFDVCEIEDRIVFTVRAEQSEISPSTVTAIGLSGWSTISFVA